LNQAEAMEVFGVRSRATWAKWVKGGLPRRPQGRGFSYDEDEVRAWLDETGTKLGTQGGDTTGGMFEDTQALYEKERALKTAAERELRELKLAEERGELVRAADVEAEWARAATLIRSRVMEIAPKVLQSVLAAEGPLETEAAIRAGCRQALEALADG